MGSDAIRRLVAAIPIMLALVFLAFAPSEGANIGGGILVLVAIPISLLVYFLLKLGFRNGD